MSESIPAKSELPRALITRDQWLCWRAERRDGTLTKVPIDPASGAFASTADSATWSGFETAANRGRSEETEGVGFVFTDGDPIVGVDLDDCRDPESGSTKPWATDIIDRLDSYTECSPSGTGYHILVEGSLPDGRNRKGDLEIYETARFFTVTGERVDGTPPSVESRPDELEAIHGEYLVDADRSNGSDGDPEARATESSPASSLSDGDLLERAKTAKNGGKFARLWGGSAAGYESNSEADMALCSLLAFWTGGDAARMDRLFRDSGLLREKWDERHFADGSTYGEKTIERAIDMAYDRRGITDDVETHRRESPTVRDVLDVLEAMSDDLSEYVVRVESEEAKIEADAVWLLGQLRPFTEGGQFENLGRKSEFDIRDEKVLYLDLVQQGGSIGGQTSLLMELLISLVYERAKETEKEVVFVIDEARYLMKDSATLEYLETIFRHHRHHDLSIQLITQTVDEFLSRDIAKVILDQCSIKQFHKLDGMDEAIAEEFGLNHAQMNYVQTAQPGDEERGYSEALLGIDGEWRGIEIRALDAENAVIENESSAIADLEIQNE